jgi:hypothetical protein
MSTNKRPFTLEDDTLDFIGEMLTVAQSSLEDLLFTVHRKCPEAALNESLRKWIERAQELRAQIEGR